jgi:hypothetical protein
LATARFWTPGSSSGTGNPDLLVVDISVCSIASYRDRSTWISSRLVGTSALSRPGPTRLRPSSRR